MRFSIHCIKSSIIILHCILWLIPKILDYTQLFLKHFLWCREHCDYSKKTSKDQILASHQDTMPHGIGVPIKLLHECVGHIICVETISGEMFRGQLDGAEVCSSTLCLSIFLHIQMSIEYQMKTMTKNEVNICIYPCTQYQTICLIQNHRKCHVLIHTFAHIFRIP